MARGRKKQVNLTLQEQLKIVEEKITELDSKMNDLKVQRKELNKKIKEEEKEKLYNAVLQSGKTIEQIISIISEKEEN